MQRKATAALDIAGLQPLADTLRSRPVILGVVGDRARVDLDALGRIAEVVEVEAAELTSFGAFPPAVKPARE